nr:heavy metal translocating P-type ATPase [Hephaestia sp. MAHUQ-44]
MSADELVLASRLVEAGTRRSDLSVPGIRCGNCIRKIEEAIRPLPGVVSARVNLSARSVAVDWREHDGPPPLGPALAALGYEAYLRDNDTDDRDPELGRMIRALAVAGFAAMNIMGLSVSVWSGAAGETRDLFHWLSAAIALPALAYSGRIFFASAWQALKHGRTNMDVPISIGVLLAFSMSLYDTIHGQPHAYFDAATSLLFFLLIGRTLDHMMRARAKTAVAGLGRLAAYGATVIMPDGTKSYMLTSAIKPGMVILVAAGDRIPVDAVVHEGRSDIDASLATGESAPETVAAGARLRAGMLNLTGPLTIVATAAARDSFLAEMIGLMETAEGGRSRYRRIADRAARLYAPVVHSAALLSFLGWMLATGDWHRAVTIAIAVLIVTCPCALGLAVPMVQVVAARALYDRGIMVKDGSALERLAEADTVVFDKTGTLTMGQPTLRHPQTIPPPLLAMAARIAAHSRHPYAQAIAAAGGSVTLTPDTIVEHPGEGLEARIGDHIWRLGRADWALAEASDARGTILARDGVLAQAFTFDDMLRPHAVEAAAHLRARGYPLEIMSGDTEHMVAAVGAELGIETRRAGLLPVEKTAHLATLAEAGRKVLMVGDGLNDAPALMAAHVSIAPGSAADIGRQAADLVFLQSDLQAVPQAIEVALAAKRLIRQNFGFAILYNAVALPLAITGMVTPLIAALAMSGSSIVVVANALRLASRGAARQPRRRKAEGRPVQRPLAKAI